MGMPQIRWAVDSRVPQGLAIDGAGDLYVADPASGRGGGSPARWSALPERDVWLRSGEPNVAWQWMEGAMSLSPDSSAGRVLEIPANGVPPDGVYSDDGFCPHGVGSGCSGRRVCRRSGPAVRFGDYRQVQQRNYQISIWASDDWGQPQSVAVDAAGDVYVTDIGSSKVIEVPAGLRSATLPDHSGQRSAILRRSGGPHGRRQFRRIMDSARHRRTRPGPPAILRFRLFPNSGKQRKRRQSKIRRAAKCRQPDS